MQMTTLDQWVPNLGKDDHSLVIAGPCSAESEEQVLDAARQLSRLKQVRLFRAGIWKPRTRPGSFEGVGDVGLPWMQKVKEETGLPTTVEVANARHVEQALKHDIDVLWLGARTSANPFSVQEIADALNGVDIPVMVKNPINADLALWIGAIERIENAGITKLAAIHRGFSSHAKTQYRNPPMWKIPIELKRRYPELPIICDPSHIGGKRDLIYRICQKALDVDMDGLMVEVHPNPSVALSDMAQQVTPGRLVEILGSLDYRKESADDSEFEVELDKLRAKIDRVDHDLVETLHLRMNIVDKIGKLKIKNNVTAFQVKRMDEMINKQMEMGQSLGLKPEYIKELYNIVHEESVRVQTELMRVATEEAHSDDKK